MELVVVNGRAAPPGGATAQKRLRPTPGSPALIGRERELAMLLEVATSPPGLVLVEGEAGIGKTRLIEELLVHVDRNARRVLVGHSDRVLAPAPFGPVIDALRGLATGQLARRPSLVAGALAGVVPELCWNLPPAIKPLADPRADRHRVSRAIIEVLDAVGPALLVLEDLHWADPATVELLGSLLARPLRDVSIIVTYRRQGTERDLAIADLMSRAAADTRRRAIQLAALTPTDVRSLIGAMLRRDHSADTLATQVFAWTSGIPFAVDEVVRTICARDPLLAHTDCVAGFLDTHEIPAPNRDAIVARLGPLSADARLVLRAAAALGEPADEDLITAVAALSPERGANALTEALTAGALAARAAGTYAVRHRLGARAVYQGLSEPQRKRLHLRAARALRDRAKPPLADVARHLKESGSAEWPRYLEAAAKAARVVGGERLATSLLEEALTAPGLSRAARVRLAMQLSDAATFGVASNNTIDILRRAVEEDSMSETARGALRFSVSILLGHAGDVAWRAEAARAILELDERPELQVQAMMNLAQPAWRSQGDLDEDHDWLRRAMVTLESCEDPATLAAVNLQRAAILLSVGDRAGWSVLRSIPRSGQRTNERLDLLRGYHAVAMTALSLGHHRRGSSLLAVADRLHAEVGNPWWDLWLGTAHACLDWIEGRWGGLEMRLRDLLRETVGMASLTIDGQHILGSLLLARGRLDEASQILTTALENASGARHLSARIPVAGRLARVYLELEQHDAAWEVAQLGLDALRLLGNWLPGRCVVPEATDALIRSGAPAGARALVAEFAAGLHGRDCPAAKAALAVCRGAVADACGDADAAARRFAQAERGWAALPHSLEAARARERRAGCLPKGNAQERNDLLIGAFEVYDGLGAAGDAGRVRARLRAVRAWRGGRRGYGNKLSPREQEVALLAAGGKTNREIAATLIISPRTVEAHVAASLRKLSLASRDELASVVEVGQKIGSATHS
jgi:DNA-binding CsgD family transcriptional regulator/tetratricopeptide (TPR) repeat protein